MGLRRHLVLRQNECVNTCSFHKSTNIEVLVKIKVLMNVYEYMPIVTNLPDKIKKQLKSLINKEKCMNQYYCVKCEK
jgi:hypothetical protein